MIRIYMGKSAAGKDYMFRKDVKNGWKPIVTYTTRPMREKEVDGKDYFFITEEMFKAMAAEDKFLEWRVYDTLVNGKPARWFYGSPFVDATTDNVAVITPEGILPYIDKYGADNLDVYYVTASVETRTKRARNRDPKRFDETEWNRRLAADDADFAEHIIDALKNRLGENFHEICNE